MGRERKQTRRRALQTIGSGVVVGLAGCNSVVSSDPTGQPTDTETATSTPTSTETPTESPTETTTHEHTDAQPPESVEFARNPEEVHATLVEQTSVSSDEVLIGYRLEDSSLPFETEVYHAPDDAEMQATKTYDTQDLSQVDLLPDQPQALDTVATDQEDIHYGTTTIGEPLAVTLVARHDGEAFDWSAWDRTGYPFAGHDEENPAPNRPVRHVMEG